MQYSPKMTRRNFVQATGLAATSLLAGQSGRAFAVDAKRPAHMKLALSAYSFNKFLPRNWYSRSKKSQASSMTLFDFMDFAADTGFDAVELTSYYFPKPLDPLMASEIKNYAFRLGLDISGTAIGNDFCLNDGPELENELELARTWLSHANAIDAPVIRIFAGKVRDGENKDEVIARCAANIRSLLPAAEESGVVLALENHGGITAEPGDMLAIIEAVGESPFFGVNLDGGNFRIADPYEGLARIAPYAVNAQLKMEVRRSLKGPGEPADLARTIEILRDAKYRGYVALEYEEDADPKTTIPGIAAEIRQLISEANGSV